MTQDTFLYNGQIDREKDLEFIRLIAAKKVSDTANLVLVTPGGNPDAAFKIARYFQSRYSKFTVTVPGICKSAGTLLALGAHELVFAPYGELGPLDIQMSRVDHLTGMESGLNISEAFQSLEQRARAMYHRTVADILASSNGIISFYTASHAAIEAMAAMYGPIFARIDPEEVGSRSRAMRIGQDYGRRLNAIGQNLQEGALAKLAQTYSSHGFVIDSLEAKTLFLNVREASVDEIAAIEAFGDVSRLPMDNLFFDKVDWPEAPLPPKDDEDQNVQPQDDAGGAPPDPGGDDQNPQGAGGA